MWVGIAAVSLFVWASVAQVNTQGEFLQWLDTNDGSEEQASMPNPQPRPSSAVPSSLTRKPTNRNNNSSATQQQQPQQPQQQQQPQQNNTPATQPIARTEIPSAARRTGVPTKQPATPTTQPTVQPTPSPTRAFEQPKLQYRVRSASYPDKCLTTQGKSDEDAILAPCAPAVLYSNQSFVSIPQVPQYEGDVVTPGLVQLVNGVVWAWTYPADSSFPNQVRLTDMKVYGTGQNVNFAKCISVPRMNEAPTYPVYWFPCIVNSSNVFILEPILAANYTSSPPAIPPSPGMDPEDLTSNAPYSLYPPGPQTPPPATCKPVKLSHIGRHGSRHATDMTQFMSAVSRMVSAQRVGSLTDFGEELLRRAQQVVFDVRNIQLSSLTPQGQEEVYNYSLRMVRNFPEIFQNAPNSSIIADSTDLDRTLSSRKQSFYAMRDGGVSLSALVSTFAPSVCTTEYNTLRMWEGCRELYIYLADDVNFIPASELKSKNMGDAAVDFYNMVFTQGWESAKGVASNGRVLDRIQFLDDLWRYICAIEAAVNSSHITSPIGVCGLLPKKTGQLLAYNEDVVSYRSYGRYTPTATTFASSCLLHREVQTDFEDYMQGKKHARAHLRFTHREAILPFLSAMNIYTRDPYFLQDVDWTDREFKTTDVRMASNIQFILYECDNPSSSNKTYYLKMLLNEVEVLIPGCGSVYCPWDRYMEIAATGCTPDQFKALCNGLIVFCGNAREIALSQQRNPNDVLAGPPPVPYGSSPFDMQGIFGDRRNPMGDRNKSGRSTSDSKAPAPPAAAAQPANNMAQPKATGKRLKASHDESRNIGAS